MNSFCSETEKSSKCLNTDVLLNGPLGEREAVHRDRGPLRQTHCWPLMRFPQAIFPPTLLPSEPQWASRRWRSSVLCPWASAPGARPRTWTRPGLWPGRTSSRHLPLRTGPYRSGSPPARSASSSASPPRSDRPESQSAEKETDGVMDVAPGCQRCYRGLDDLVGRRHFLLQAVQQTLDG